MCENIVVRKITNQVQKDMLIKEDTDMAKTLIAFFSRADENYFGGAMRYVKVGNTEIVVGLMKEARPELVSMPESIDEYDTIVLAYPNYWGTMPMAVFTFLEAFDFTGKTILPLCTNEGSGLGSSERDIKKYAKGAVLKKGLSITGSQAANSKGNVQRWFSANGLI